ncbi:MAG: alkaline phosphatase family protein [Candidatus Omnitrophica bacterium]|nr:alkaline phosphatase family protein [Candidatus Omnitrophota bacterium]
MIFGYIDPGTGFTVASASGALLAFLLGALSTCVVFFKKIFNFLKRNKGWATIIFIGIVIVVIFGVVVMQKSSSTFDKKVIVIGFDALSPKIMEPMMAHGKLKNFARLKAQGGYSRLATTNPPESPVAWSAFSTGKNSGKNGIFDFITRDAKDYSLSLSLSNTEGGVAKPVIKAKRFWQYTSEKKIPTVILGCPVTFPPDQVYGKMLSGMGVPDVLGTEGTFSFYTSLPDENLDTTGGKVFFVKKSHLMISDFWGPRVKEINGSVKNVQVPFKMTFPTTGTVEIEYQKKKVVLREGQWSDWQEIVFDLGLFRKSRAIFKFFVVATEPHLKLYVSPFNIDPRDPFFPITHPAEFAKTLSEEIGLFHTQGMPFDTWSLNEKRLDEKVFLQQVDDVLQEREKMLAVELKKFKKGVFSFYFEDPDIIQHMFWRYIDSQHPLYEANAPAEYKNIIYDWYEKMDVILGKVMVQLGPEDTLLVLSDHGFDTYRRTVHVNSWLREQGLLELKDAGALMGEPLLKDIDWTKTKAYAIGFGSIYINEKGRESQGIVDSVKKAQIKDQIAKGLKSWVDAKFNEHVVNKVYFSENVYSGPYTVKQGPDLVVGFNIGYGASWQTALGAVPAELIEDNLRKWSGTHLFDPLLVDGVLFSNRPIVKKTPSIMDLSPTILHVVGFSDEEIKSFDFDGQPLF